MNEGRPFEPKGSSRDLLGDLLSEEETRDLLAPYPGDGGGSEEVVLLLTEDPGEAERISAYLTARGVRTSPVQQRYDALDRLRAHDYQAFVMAVDAIGATPSSYLERVHESEAVPMLGFILPEEGPVPAWIEDERADLARRPLGPRELARLFPWLPEVPLAEATSPLARTSRSEADVGISHGSDPDDGPEDGVLDDPVLDDPVLDDSVLDDSVLDDLGEHAGVLPSGSEPYPPGGGRSLPPRDAGSPSAGHPGRRPPDWLAAVRRLLEARGDGAEVEDALRDWAETDPACAGWGRVEERDGERVLRAGGPDRDALLAALAAELVEYPEPPPGPGRRGGFGCLPGDDAWLAIWWRNRAGAAGWDRFAGLIPLVERLVPGTAAGARGGAEREDPHAAERVRARLLRHLDGRMHAVRRHGGSTALLLLEPPTDAALLPLLDLLEPRLRGEDAIEVEDGRVWAVLERTEGTAPSAIGTRLLEFAGDVPFRAVGAIWRAGGPGAEELAEHLLDAIAERPSDGTIDWVL